MATSFNNLGCTYDKKGEYDKAIEYLTKALKIRQKVLGNDHPDVIFHLIVLGVLFRQILCILKQFTPL